MTDDLPRDRRRPGGPAGAPVAASRAQVALLLVAMVAAASAACGPESFNRSGEGGTNGGGGAGDGVGGNDAVDAPVEDDAADAGTSDDAPAGDAAEDVRADGDGATDGGVIFTCPATIDGMLESTDPTQVGRHSRIPPSSICGTVKAYPTNQADPTFPHVYDVYRFANPRTTAACFTFTLTYPIVDAGMGNDRYLAAYTSFNPADIGAGYLGDVGSVTTSPQTMGITVAAGTTIDVVVYAIQATNSGNPYTGPYSLGCAAQ